MHGDAFQGWVNILIKLNPSEMHIYSVGRPRVDRRVEHVQPCDLQRIAADLRAYDYLPIKAHWSQGFIFSIFGGNVVNRYNYLE